MSTGKQGDGHPLVRILLGTLFVLTVILVTIALFRRSFGEGPGAHARYLASGCILAFGVVAFVVAGLVAARRRRILTAALKGNAPIRIPATRIRMVVLSLVLVLIAAGCVIAITDATVDLIDRVGAFLVCLVTGSLGLAGLFLATFKRSPLTIGSDGVAYPAVWQGTIPWESISDARVVSRIGVGDVYVLLTIDPVTSCPLKPNWRHIAQSLKLQSSERPIPGTSFGVTPEALLARIERCLDSAKARRRDDQEGADKAKPIRSQYVGDSLEELNRKVGDGLTLQQRADLMPALGLFLLVFLATDIIALRWARLTPGVDFHTAWPWILMASTAAGAVAAWLFLLVRERRRRR